MYGVMLVEAVRGHPFTASFSAGVSIIILLAWEGQRRRQVPVGGQFGHGAGAAGRCRAVVP